MRTAVIRTGTANLASVLSGLRRAGADPYITDKPEDVLRESRVILPGVGSFGAAMAELRARGLNLAITERFRSGRPLAGFCLGMQLFFEASEESPGIQGLGLLPGKMKKYPGSVKNPRQGWGLVMPDPGPGCLEPGWGAFANSYRLEEPPGGLRTGWADYAGPFAAALERPGLLLCQFHPELSGSWGCGLLARWLASDASGVGRAVDALFRPPPGSLPGAESVRVIPCLDVDAGRVVKGTRFLELRDAGDPAELAARYEAEGADEIVLLDITAGIERRAARADTVRRVRDVLGIPLTVGGGISSAEDAAAL
ncbi:MAG TPA: imidazole glycerol phosphate synthase subunit HisH, partial [Magnetospirillaceae bacterium]|nr:imidazole glycerol phosphate synthase subunit HisH [Magnetospirillaceae bacterium]